MSHLLCSKGGNPERYAHCCLIRQKNMTRSIGSLPALRNFVLTLNYGLVCSPNEACRVLPSHIEGIIEKLDLDAWATLFRRAIPTLVDVAVRRSRDRTPRDMRALYGPHWACLNL